MQFSESVVYYQKDNEYGFQKIGKNFSYPVSEKFATPENNDEVYEEEIDEIFERHNHDILKESEIDENISCGMYWYVAD